jgi:phosphoenolpyruvate carboxylase
MNIAREYAALCVDAGVGKRVYDVIREEYGRSIHQILNVADIQSLLEETPALADSLSQRNTFLDPLNQIQASLLRKLRQDESDDSAWLEPLLRSINAIAAGMRNTG